MTKDPAIGVVLDLLFEMSGEMTEMKDHIKRLEIEMGNLLIANIIGPEPKLSSAPAPSEELEAPEFLKQLQEL